MSLSPAERDAAFVFYSLAFAGTPMPVPLPTVSTDYEQIGAVILAAAIVIGARGHMRGADPLTRAEVAEAVEAALWEAPAPDAASAPDATLAALEAYREGVEDTLVAVGKWWDADGNGLVGWIAARRAAGPKRGMTAREVLCEIEERLGRGGLINPILTDLRAELGGGYNV